MGVFENLPELTRGLQTLFFGAYDAALKDSLRDIIAMKVESKGDAEIYSWLGDIGEINEWVDERKIQTAINNWNFTIVNRKWEATLEVRREDIDDDKLGQLRPKILNMGQAFALHQEELVVSALINGFSTPCYDGVNFFASNHPVGPKATQSNTSNKALNEDNLKDAISAMRGFKNDKGRVLKIRPTHLLVGPANEWLAREIVEREATDEGKPNLLKGSIDVLVSEYIEDSKWFLLSLDRPLKPVIYQERDPVEFVAWEKESEYSFMRDAYLYGARARYAAGTGLWQLAYGSTGTA